MNAFPVVSTEVQRLSYVALTFSKSVTIWPFLGLTGLVPPPRLVRASFEAIFYREQALSAQPKDVSENDIVR